MALYNRQPKWDIYEAVILLDGYLKVMQENQPRAKVVKQVSTDLRQMAANRGIIIDDAYRNENGISYQIQSMDSAYKDRTVYVPATRLFNETVGIYRTNRERYLKVLREAKSMVTSTQNNKESFLTWTASNLSVQRCTWIEVNILKVERLAVAANLIIGSIFDITDVATLEDIYRTARKSIVFKIKNRKHIKSVYDDFEAYIQYCLLIHEHERQENETESFADYTLEAALRTVTTPSDSDNDVLSVDFSSKESISFTKPKRIVFMGTELSKPSTWKDVYVTVVSFLFIKYPEVFSSLSSIPGSTRLEFGNNSSAIRMTAPREIQENLCVETNFSATNIINRLKKLLSLCGVAYDDLKIEYERKSRSSTSKNATPIDTPVSPACETSFYSYLHNTAKLSDRTCTSYVSSIKSAERYAENHGYASSFLFCDDKNTIVRTAAKLYGDPHFVKYNKQQHNRFKNAINKLLDSIGAEIPEKALASHNGSKRPNTTSEGVNSEIVAVLKKHYEYGLKYDSIREIMRFRQFAEAMEIALPEDDASLKASIVCSGTVIDDKVYCMSDDLPNKLQHIIDGVFSSGVGVIYYESLFEREQDWMKSHLISSSNMLKECIQKSISGCSFSKNFIIKGNKLTENEVVTAELMRVWGSQPSESVSNLIVRLPYIPRSIILRVISGNNLFALASEGEYLLIDRFRITQDEEKDILGFVEETCKEYGYASLSSIPLCGIEEEYYELSRPAILNAIYKKVLLGKYHMRGKILTKEKSERDAVMLLKQYIQNKEECTFDDIAGKVAELTGGINRQYAFQALYDDMVRVDKERFVANRFVNFSVDEVDAALSDFITDKFRAIRDVTTFAMFPLCGQNWNHYLLESYCYKYSRKYSLHVIHFNDKNAGIIAEKDYNKNYNEMLAIALARADVKLSPEFVGQFLFNTGYMAKSKFSKLCDIAQQAEQIRKER